MLFIMADSQDSWKLFLDKSGTDTDISSKYDAEADSDMAEEVVMVVEHTTSVKTTSSNSQGNYPNRASRVSLSTLLCSGLAELTATDVTNELKDSSFSRNYVFRTLDKKTKAINLNDSIQSWLLVNESKINDECRSSPCLRSGSTYSRSDYAQSTSILINSAGTASASTLITTSSTTCSKTSCQASQYIPILNSPIHKFDTNRINKGHNNGTADIGLNRTFNTLSTDFSSTCTSSNSTLSTYSSSGCCKSATGSTLSTQISSTQNDADSETGSEPTAKEIRQGHKDTPETLQALKASDSNSKDASTEQGPALKRRRYHFYPEPVEVLQMECCVDMCLKHVSIIDIETCHLLSKHKKENEQLNYILHEISSHTLLRKKSASFKFIIGNQSVCENAWCKAYNVTKWRFKKCIRAYKKGISRLMHGNRGRRKLTTKTTNALGWMRHYFERIGDYMPHKSEVHLPSTWTKGSVYRKMRAEFIDRGFSPNDVISPSYFSHLWLQHLPEFVISKQREFTVCSTCAELLERGLKARTTREHDAINTIKKQHDETVSKERAAYHQIRERAQKEPSEYTVIIVDGMDQSKTDVPKVVKDKDLAPLNKLHTHLTGVLLHTDAPEGKIPYIYVDVKQIPHDSNMTMNIILDVLINNEERLGRVLFLQLDNCYRENKNRYLLSFSSLLVDLGVFEEVIIHFLPVGHTHEDVDQMFSCISREMSKQDSIFTLEELKLTVEKSYTPRIRVKEATPQFNIKEWMEPHMAGRFHNHSQPHWFRFRRNGSDIRMHYKMWVDDPWLPEPELGPDNQTIMDDSSLGLICFSSLPDVQVPPEWVIPSLDKLDVDGLLKDLPYGYASRMPEDKQRWWHDYMTNIESLTEIPVEPRTWPLVKLINRLAATRPVWEIDDGLQRLKTKVVAECPRIKIGKQGAINYRQAKLVNSYETMKLHELTVINLDGYPATQQPFIARVLEILESSVVVHWMEGAYNREWKESFKGTGRNRSKVTDVIPKQSILLFGFQLTRKGRLRAETVKHIKQLYTELVL